MSRTTIQNTILLLLTAVCGGLGLYVMFIQGTTGGHDFIRMIKPCPTANENILSIEVVDPAVGHTPFSAKELDRLKPYGTIRSTATINRLLARLRDARPGVPARNLNHPVTRYCADVKINAKDGFYWLYCEVLEGKNGAFLSVEANTRNATNPNGANAYYLEHFSEVLEIIKER